ncbi:hypothetical protein [Dyadobacter psychrotolerans]|uniref:Uncharacterized protein n=1 Tax=Dyadobacter psychrotolerans TaxID=2541721 RepID=A0A4R5DZS5_9BACT|nr:hypothetical protein [Dyadobacter psychrotolerans]TDE17711.1 hypothetical protein E0F88_07420 [Dyadobacter psychrotolerans]
MRKEKGVYIDLSKLANLRKKLGTELVAKVGIMGSDATALHKESVTKYNTETGKPYKTAGSSTYLTNAELGVIHEFGSASRNIPIRSFLRMPLMEKSKEIVKMLGNKDVMDLIKKGEVVQVFRLIGLKGEQIVDRAFQTQGFGHWPALKPQTVDAKGSSSPLIDTGQLRRSITSTVDKA